MRAPLSDEEFISQFLQEPINQVNDLHEYFPIDSAEDKKKRLENIEKTLSEKLIILDSATPQTQQKRDESPLQFDDKTSEKSSSSIDLLNKFQDELSSIEKDLDALRLRSDHIKFSAKPNESNNQGGVDPAFTWLGGESSKTSSPNNSTMPEITSSATMSPLSITPTSDNQSPQIKEQSLQTIKEKPKSKDESLVDFLGNANFFGSKRIVSEVFNPKSETQPKSSPNTTNALPYKPSQNQESTLGFLFGGAGFAKTEDRKSLKPTINSQSRKPSQNQESTLGFLFGGMGFSAQRVSRPTPPSQHPKSPMATNIWIDRASEKTEGGHIIHV